MRATGRPVRVRQGIVSIANGSTQFDNACINDFGQRIQAFAGCATAAGGDAKMAGYFVFLVDVETEAVFEGLVKLGCRPRVHYSIHKSGTGCIACPCDCPGGIIADNRFPIYDPKPMTCAAVAGVLLTASFVRANTLEVLDAQGRAISRFDRRAPATTH